jgi:hypothetical protein
MALLPAPLGDPSRPSPALMNAVYLWGIHLSQSSELLMYENLFLRRSLRQLSLEVSSAPDFNFMHTIQAQVLLAVYSFRTNAFFEAEYHTNAAVSLAIGYDLHKIRSSRYLSSTLLGLREGTELYTHPAHDSTDEGERINGFWTVYCLQRKLSMALRSSSEKSFGSVSNPDQEIDTPWPLDIETYASVSVL